MCLYKAIVDDNNDPEGRGRLRLLIPSVLGDEATDWAWPCIHPGWPTQVDTESAGVGDHGSHSHNMPALVIPAKKDGVWVMFEGGDESSPVWMGTWAVSGTVSPP